MYKNKYIRVYDGKFLITEDNFKTYRETKNIEGYQLLKSRNTTTEVFLRYTYGDRKATILISEFKNINRTIFPNEKKIDDGYGHAFEVFALSVFFDLTYDQAIRYIVSGKEDGKIDAIYWDTNNVYIFQIKLNSIIDAYVLETAKKNFKQYISSGTITEQNTSDLLRFLKTNKSNIENKALKVCSITSSKSINNNINAQELFDKFFKNMLLPRKKSNISLMVAINEIKDLETGLSCKNMTQSNDNIFVFANADQFVQSLNNQGITFSTCDKLFYDNVRGFIGENQSMQQTIEQTPEKFELYNNGISVIGKSKLLPTSIIVENPLIINGQQTLCNLLIAKERNINLTHVSIPVFIKTVSDKLEQLNIARFNNTQKQVKDIDILSLNSDLRIIQEELLNKSIQNNFNKLDSFYLQLITSGHRISDNHIKKLFNKNNVISLTDFIRTYWVTEEQKLLGDWKNNVNKMINEKIIESSYRFDKNKAESKCKTIRDYKDFLDSVEDKTKRNQYQVADVAFLYLLNIYSIDICRNIIDHINNHIFVETSKSKLIDLYKSNNIINLIEQSKKDLHIR